MPEGSSVVTWLVVYAKQAAKDAARIKNSGLKEKTQELLISRGRIIFKIRHRLRNLQAILQEPAPEE